MSDLGRYFPLSQRPDVDESAVTSDRRNALADVILATEAMLLGDRDLGRDFAERAGLGAEAGTGDLRLLAEQVRAGKKRPIRALSRAVTAQLELARDLGVVAQVDPKTIGAVVLYRTGAAPLEIRAVLTGHTLQATDAEWSFGHGPVLQDTALRILAFICGVSDEAPRPLP
ncbi:MAG TPA: hypothetical protein VFY91_02850 [Microbacterium sp.]|nr:hypothetical protein [Microbacterium sp.]